MIALSTVASKSEIHYHCRMVTTLNDEQLAAWRSFLEVHSAVIGALEREILEEEGFPLTWYEVLVHLSEAPERRLHHQVLAKSVLLSRSGVTRLVDRMVEAGLVAREPDPNDRRASYVAMTRNGEDTLKRAAPGHVRSVWKHFIRHLNAEEIPMLTSIFSRLLQGQADEER